MAQHMTRRTLLGGGMVALGATAAGPRTYAAEDSTADQAAPDAACWATPLAHYAIVFHHAAGGRGLDGPGLVRLADGKLIAAVPVTPGGKDDVSRLFWAMVNLAVDGQHRFEFKDPQARNRKGQPYHETGGGSGANDRRFLMLMYGLDGLNWFPAGCVARAGRLGQSFMYASQVFDGDDLAIVSRSSVAAHSRHDGDYCTFHRVRNFRRLAMNLRQDIDAG